MYVTMLYKRNVILARDGWKITEDKIFEDPPTTSEKNALGGFKERTDKRKQKDQKYTASTIELYPLRKKTFLRCISTQTDTTKFQESSAKKSMSCILVKPD